MIVAFSRLGAALTVLATAGPTLAAPNVTVAAAPPPSPSDWRAPDPQKVLVIETSKGRIIVEMSPEVAPLAVARVRELARAGFYDGRSFFRVLDNFMDQTGDPTDTGTGGSAKPDLPGEFVFRRGAATPLAVIYKSAGFEEGFIGAMPVISQTLDLALLTADQKVAAYGTFCPGVAGMARADSPDSANSQFFLMRAAQTNLDQKYAPWARVIAGLDVVRAIKTGEPVPAPQDKMLTVRLLADIPIAQRPTVRVIDPASPWFKATAERLRTQKGADPSVCDLDLPSDVK